MSGTAREITEEIRRGRTRHSCKVGIYNNTRREKNNRKEITTSNPRDKSGKLFVTPVQG